MGFTPLEGLVMATRSGSVDPGLLLWLLEHGRLEVGAVAQALEHESGLLGLAGSADIGTPGAHVRTLVIVAREDLQIAREVRALLSLGPAQAGR